MGTVTPIASANAADAAWREYQEAIGPMVVNPALFLDRPSVEAAMRAHDRFKRAFLALDSASAGRS